MDLYRHAGHRSGHLRDLRRGRPPALRRQPQGQVDPDGGPRRHGRRAAAGRRHGRRLLPCRRMRARPHRFPPAHPLCRRARRDARRGAGDDRPLDQGRRGEVGRPARQRRRHPARAGQARRAARHGHRPDLGARSAQRLPAEGLDAGRMARQAHQRSQGGREGGARLDARACRGDGRLLERRRADARLRQQHPPGGARGRCRERLRLPRLRAGLYPPAVLPRHRPVPLGRAVRRSGGHLQDRRQGEGADAGQHASAQLARHGARAHRLPGPAGAHLLGRPRRPPPARPRLQRDGGQAAS